MVYQKNQEHEIRIPLRVEDIMLNGNLYIPGDARGLILFAHGSGSGRFSPRNRFVAQYLNLEKYATLLFDLLTRTEEATDLLTAEFRFDIKLLADRLGAVTDWIINDNTWKNFL